MLERSSRLARGCPDRQPLRARAARCPDTMLAFLRSCLFGPDDRPKLRPPPRSEAAPFTLLNDSTHEVQVWKNGNGPITRVAPRSSAVIDAERHGGLRFTGVLADAFDARVLDKSTVVVVAHWAPRAAPGLVVRVDDADTRRVDALVAAQHLRLERLHRVHLGEQLLVPLRHLRAQLAAERLHACGQLLGDGRRALRR